MAKLPLDMALWDHTTLNPARPDAMVSFCMYHLSWCQLVLLPKQSGACWAAFIMIVTITNNSCDGFVSWFGFALARPRRKYDVLFVRDIGKHISGAGMDTNIIGRGAYEHVPGKPWQEDHPSINRIVCSDIPAAAHGNPGGPGQPRAVPCSFCMETHR
jgi:hypothetical protein